ncbi:hypothetical protein CRUP_014006 [Coryphaenoides rupestris]|nr:hypothetical protein CRUP_014006 [Coryphaenoides rupestris]
MNRKMAVSVNILPRTSAMYYWKGEVTQSTEIVMLVKTKTSKIQKVIDYVKWDTTPPVEVDVGGDGDDVEILLLGVGERGDDGWLNIARVSLVYETPPVEVDVGGDGDDVEILLLGV